MHIQVEDKFNNLKWYCIRRNKSKQKIAVDNFELNYTLYKNAGFW
jgi:hypothetical protein